MKRKILIALTAFTVLAFFGGTYLLIEINESASAFNELVTLHQVEIHREHLLLNIRQVQGNIYSLGTRFPASIDEIESNIQEMDRSIRVCFGCHHKREVLDRLDDLKQQIGEYKDSFSRLLTMQANAPRMQEERDKTRIIGDSLISKMNTMIVLTDSNLNEQTDRTLHELRQSRITVMSLIVAGPLLFAIVGFTMIRQVTNPLQVLHDATVRLRGGNLDHRITGLSDEFADLAKAFNDMAGSLRAHMRAIEESEMRYRLLFESAADAIFILEAEGERAGRIIQANAAAAAMHGYSIEELTAMYVRDLNAPPETSGSKLIERMLAGEWITDEHTHRKKDGTAFPVEMSAGAFETAGRKFILAIDRDITDRRRAEREVRHAHRVKLAGEMATSIAHEIKNPLAGIKIAMEALAETPYLAEDDRDVLRQVIGQIDRIESLLKGILNFARPPRPQLAPTDVNDILESVAFLMQKGVAAQRAIRVEQQFDERCPEILADPQQLQQVFMNLLMNAADALPKGGTITLKTSFEEERHAVRIEISDDGPGIDADLQDTLFEPFVTTKAKGAGLGLAVSRRLVEEHGGVITGANRPGGGACFTVLLPVAAHLTAKGGAPMP